MKVEVSKNERKIIMNIYDLVILLPGNSYICYIEKSQIQNIEKSIVDQLNKPDQMLKLNDGNRTAQIRPSSILGWYFKPHEKPIGEKMLDVVKKVVEPPEESWKHSDE